MRKENATKLSQGLKKGITLVNPIVGTSIARVTRNSVKIRTLPNSCKKGIVWTLGS